MAEHFRAGFHAFVESVALHHPGHGHLGGHADDVGEGEGAEPLAVVADLEFFGRGVDDLAGLLEVGRGVDLHLLRGEHGAGLGSARGVADHGGVVADDEDGPVPAILEIAELLEDHGVPQGKVGGGGVHAQLGPQRLARGDGLLDLLGEFLAGVDAVHAAKQDVHLCVEIHHDASRK